MALKEFHLRGMYLSSAAQVEFVLTEIMCYCFIKERNKRERFKLIMLGDTSLGTKIEVAQKAVQDYNEEYYNAYKSSFEKINKLCKERNVFAHSMAFSDPNEKDNTSLVFQYIKKNKIVTDSKNLDTLTDFILQVQKDVRLLTELAVTIFNEREKKSV